MARNGSTRDERYASVSVDGACGTPRYTTLVQAPAPKSQENEPPGSMVAAGDPEVAKTWWVFI